MKKITLMFENEYYGKSDTIKKVIDCEFQAGNASSSEELQAINVIRSFCLSLYDFAEKIGVDADLFKSNLNAMYNIHQNIDEEDPEDNFDVAEDQIDISDLNTDLDFETFVQQFKDSEEFQRTVFGIFSSYMDDEDDE